MPIKPYRPRALQGNLFRGSDAITEGLLTPNQLRSHAWLRVARDVYVDSRVERSHELRCRAAGLWLPPQAAFAGRSAAALGGSDVAADFRDTVHVVVPEGFRLRSRRGLDVHQVQLGPTDIAGEEDLPRTSPTRTVWDLSNWLPPVDSVPIIDEMLRTGQVDEEVLLSYIAGRRGQRGWRPAERAVSLADGKAQSPQESRIRVRLVLAGVPRPVVQHPVSVDGLVLHPDLAWPEHCVGLEYDGVWHGRPGQLHLDRRRLNLLVAAGWTILHATSERLNRDFAGLVRELLTTLHLHGHRP